MSNLAVVVVIIGIVLIIASLNYYFKRFRLVPINSGWRDITEVIDPKGVTVEHFDASNTKVSADENSDFKYKITNITTGGSFKITNVVKTKGGKFVDAVITIGEAKAVSPNDSQEILVGKTITENSDYSPIAIAYHNFNTIPLSITYYNKAGKEVNLLMTSKERRNYWL